jgi:clathrin heavy chain
VLFVVSKAGYLFMYEITTNKCLFAQQASRVTMFASCADSSKGGITTVDQNGRVGSFRVDEAKIVNYICNTLNDYDLGVGFARRNNLGGGR